MSGPGNDWLFLTGFPHELRPSGWVYVKVEGRIVGRVRVRGVGYRMNVREHTPDDDGVHRLVSATPTLEVDPDTWEPVDIPAAETHGQGIRYIRTNEAERTVSHLVGGDVLVTHALR